ncbi:MAG: glutamine--fructose-6-phosphate aminotransferase [Bacillota bacterium]|jgi:glucosamine--fructose-6-phosphate aminotransferase (isomerizing)
MCGIVGYIGAGAATQFLMEGLKKLEYRGYDSAGIAICDKPTIKTCKCSGKLVSLVEKLKSMPLYGSVGIGHTRWATHGSPTDFNAHPHLDHTNTFAVVHNGIIENHLALKTQLKKQGVTFCSDTDTEIIVQLLALAWKGDLEQAVQEVVAKLEGSYALGVISSKEPDKIIAVRKDSPLVIGVGTCGTFLASDILAFLSHTRDVYILEDNELAVLTQNKVQIKTVTGAPIARDIFEVNWDVQEAKKSGFEHFMLKEIIEQPRAIRDTLRGRIMHGQVDLSQELSLNPSNINKVQFVACGTAYHAGLIGKYLFEELLRIPAECLLASEYRYSSPLVTDQTLVIGVSQSGETADTLGAMRLAKSLGAQTLAITNVMGSSIVREVDHLLPTWAGPEIAVASTKAYTSQLAVLYLLAGHFALAQKDTTKLPASLKNLVTSLEAVPAQMEFILQHRHWWEDLGQELASEQDLFFLGRGLDYLVALEGSLKLKEISYIHSEAYASGELKHGTLALIEEGTVVIGLLTQPNLYDKTLSNIRETQARGSRTIGLIGHDLDEEKANTFEKTFSLPNVDPLVRPLLLSLPLQLIAYYTGIARGFDVDKPRNLAKSVTVE